jgi:hypothetical protein
VFDQGVVLLTKDPLGAKAKFETAASGFERRLAGETSQWELGRTWYNIGTARQLAGDDGRAMLALRRAEHLAPALGGLGERLAAARSAARGDVAAPPAASPPTPAAPAKAETLRGEFDAWGMTKAWAFSIPRVWVWWSAVGAWGLLWMVVMVRLLLARAAWRPGVGLVLACATLAAVPVGLLVVNDIRDRAAEQTGIVMKETAARTEPDDLTGGIAPGGALRAGAEVEIVERRLGGNGEEWLRVRVGAADDVRLWVPAGVVETVADRL